MNNSGMGKTLSIIIKVAALVTTILVFYKLPSVIAQKVSYRQLKGKKFT